MKFSIPCGSDIHYLKIQYMGINHNGFKEAWGSISEGGAQPDELFKAIDILEVFFNTWLSCKSLEKKESAQTLGFSDANHLENASQNLLFSFLITQSRSDVIYPAIQLLIALDQKEASFRKSLAHFAGKFDFAEEMKVLIHQCYKDSVADFSIEFDIPYGEGEDSKQKVDCYSPNNILKDTAAPAILYFHGGAWLHGHRFPAIKRLRHFMGLGFKIFSVGYRLADEAIWPAQKEDAHAALDFIQSQAERFSIDPKKIALWGSSAGAHIAGVLVAERNKEIASFVNFCAPVAIDKHVEKVTGAMREVSPVMQLLGGEGEFLQALAMDASVHHKVDEHFPSTLIFHGEKDDTVPMQESELLYQTIKDHGVEVDLIKLPHSGHRLNDLEVKEATSQFLQAHFLK